MNESQSPLLGISKASPPEGPPARGAPQGGTLSGPSPEGRVVHPRWGASPAFLRNTRENGVRERDRVGVCMGTDGNHTLHGCKYG